MATFVERLSDFAASSVYEALPAVVVEESKRTLLDSIGCAIAAIDEPKGRIAIEFGRMLGGAGGDATIMGAGDRVSAFGAAFANAELINTLDFDAVLPPGHVTPYVLPVALAVGESAGASGKELILASAIAHEMSFRMGKAMDYLRDTKDGKVDPPAVFGYSSTIFGAAAAAGRLRKLSREVIANAIGIAASISPVNAHWPWFQHLPPSTIKYALAGHLAQTALTAFVMAELGHTGDLQILDDREFGYARFIGTKQWEPERIIDKIGEEWLFPPYATYKPYPHCRVLHSLLGCMTRVLDENDITVDEIDGIHVWVEGMVEQPAWLNREIKRVHEAQFSIAHGIAFGAHRIPPGKAWQDAQLVFSPSVMRLMGKVTHEAHPNYVALRSAHPAAQPARVEIKARGQTFVGEQMFPKGSRSSDPQSYMTSDELIAKFRVNAQGVLSDVVAEEVVEAVTNLEAVDDIGTVMRKLGRSGDGATRQAAE
jgi:2-methylcitrate dehydratase PrpD